MVQNVSLYQWQPTSHHWNKNLLYSEYKMFLVLVLCDGTARRKLFNGVGYTPGIFIGNPANSPFSLPRLIEYL